MYLSECQKDINYDSKIYDFRYVDLLNTEMIKVHTFHTGVELYLCEKSL